MLKVFLKNLFSWKPRGDTLAPPLAPLPKPRRGRAPLAPPFSYATVPMWSQKIGNMHCLVTPFRITFKFPISWLSIGFYLSVPQFLTKIWHKHRHKYWTSAICIVWRQTTYGDSNFWSICGSFDMLYFSVCQL